MATFCAPAQVAITAAVRGQALALQQQSHAQPAPHARSCCRMRRFPASTASATTASAPRRRRMRASSAPAAARPSQQCGHWSSHLPLLDDRGSPPPTQMGGAMRSWSSDGDRALWLLAAGLESAAVTQNGKGYPDQSGISPRCYSWPRRDLGAY